MQISLKPCPGCNDPEPAGGKHDRDPVACQCGFMAPDPATWNARGGYTHEDRLGSGWIVANGADDRFRVWRGGEPGWTDKREEATRFARRIDAQSVHYNDEDAWRLERFDKSASLLEVAVFKAAGVFREYEATHSAKGTLEDDAKARKNAQMAEICELAIVELCLDDVKLDTITKHRVELLHQGLHHPLTMFYTRPHAYADALYGVLSELEKRTLS